MNELSLVRALRRMPGVSGLGDDCAILPHSKQQDLLVTTDQFVENVHFTRQTHTPVDCGWKALARGLSDIAAMGGDPRYVFISLALPGWACAHWFRDFYKGLLRLASAHKAVVSGGDCTSAPLFYCDVTVLGLAPRGKALRRSSARAGDVIYVTGPLGASQLGLELGKGKAFRRHVRPQPRVTEGRALRNIATACMDLSDGLALDLHRLCVESGVSADLAPGLPIYPGATLDHALHGGEDYELLFTAPPRRRVPQPALRIGTIASGRPGHVRLDGRRISPKGWDPFQKLELKGPSSQ